MNVEELREFCLSLDPAVEEKFPFEKFKSARDILVFYVNGYMFCYFNVNDLSCVTVKSTPDKVVDLRERHACIGLPYQANSSYAKSWLGIDAHRADAALLRTLIAESFALVAQKKPKRKK